MYRHIPNDAKAKALAEAMPLAKDLKAISQKYGVSQDTLRKYHQKFMTLLPYLTPLLPKKNTRYHRLLSFLRLSVFVLKLRLYAYLQKRDLLAD